jgi:hypothetical protein
LDLNCLISAELEFDSPVIFQPDPSKLKRLNSVNTQCPSGPDSSCPENKKRHRYADDVFRGGRAQMLNEIPGDKKNKQQTNSRNRPKDRDEKKVRSTPSVLVN